MCVNEPYDLVSMPAKHIAVISNLFGRLTGLKLFSATETVRHRAVRGLLSPTMNSSLAVCHTLGHPQTRKRCCGNICCESKNVSEFVQKHFASSASVSSFTRRGNISGNNVYATIFPRLRAPSGSLNTTAYKPFVRRSLNVQQRPFGSPGDRMRVLLILTL